MANSVEDECGYLVLDALSMTGVQADGEHRTIFRRDWLDSALWSFGEDDCVALVQRALTREQVRQIGAADARLLYERDPASRKGAGYPGDKALALAAVEVLTGIKRPLARQRRRRPEQ